jgi:hypothetical protein
MRPVCLRAPTWMAALLGLLLPAWRANAADVAVLDVAQNTVMQSRTLRIPRSGAFNMDPAANGYLAVAVGISDTQHNVEAATWTSTRPGAGPPQALAQKSGRHGEDGSDGCRTEIWGLADPAAGPGYVTLMVNTTSGAAPSLAGSVITFANVASTSTDGPCCFNASNDGAGTTPATKTMFGTSRGDALVNSVCTAWSGAAPGTPAADPDGAPEMVPRSFQVMTTPNLQHFSGTSPGGDVERPATKYRHLRWVQSGTRAWALAGLELLATTTTTAAPYAGPPPPPDAGAPPPRDAGAAPPPDAAVLVPPDARAPADAASAPDQMVFSPPEPTVRLDGNLSALPGPDAGGSILPDPEDPDTGIEGDTTSGPHAVDLQVGCACRMGATAPDGGALCGALLIALALLRRRSVRR